MAGAVLFVHVGGVDVQPFVAGTGNREVAEVNVAVTLGLACERVLLEGMES